MVSDTLVCSLSVGTAQEYSIYSEQINKLYCDKHGYCFHVEHNKLLPDKHAYWDKLALLQECLKSPHEYVMFLDADAVFTNFDTRIESLITNSSITIANENLNRSDKFGENSGVLLLRNDVVSKGMIKDALDLYEACKDDVTPEQLAIALCVEDQYKNYTNQVPCLWMNAYYGQFAESINRPWCLWRPGCFIKHALMCSTEFRAKEFKTILDSIRS